MILLQNGKLVEVQEDSFKSIIASNGDKTYRIGVLGRVTGEQYYYYDVNSGEPVSEKYTSIGELIKREDYPYRIVKVKRFS